MNPTLTTLLTILEIAAATAKTLNLDPNVTSGASIADALLQIVQKAIAAHEAVTGQPIDLALLQPIDPVA